MRIVMVVATWLPAAGVPAQMLPATGGTAIALAAPADFEPVDAFGTQPPLARLDAGLNESVVFLETPDGTALETTLFKPDGPGPFPLVVYNHGKESGEAREQPRSRPIALAREFVRRGYMVAAPNRRGFAHSGGHYGETDCDVYTHGRQQAGDVAQAIQALVRRDDVDPNRILVVGASYGGLTSIAYGQVAARGVRGIVSFAGGLRQMGCADWTRDLLSAYSRYGQQVRLPTLWFYGENDPFWPAALWRAMYRDYVAAGGRAQLVDVGRYKDDAHRLVGDRDGVSTWWPAMAAFLRSIDLPQRIRYRIALPVNPPPSGFAPVDAAEAVPYLDERGRAAYRTFLQQFPARAFALSASGAWAWAEGGDDPSAVALDDCQRNSRSTCRLYAVDRQVVWTGY